MHYAPLTRYPGGAGNVSSHGVNVMPTIGGHFIYFMSGVLILLAVVWFICIILGDADIRECFSNLSFDLGSGGYYSGIIRDSRWEPRGPAVAVGPQPTTKNYWPHRLPSVGLCARSFATENAPIHMAP